MQVMLLSLVLSEEDIYKLYPNRRFKQNIEFDASKFVPDLPWSEPSAWSGAPRWQRLDYHFVYQNGVRGLQVWGAKMILARQDGLPYQWYQTHLWLTLVISCMFCRMNGRFHTVLHRVIVNKTNQRLSAASIFFPLQWI